MVEIKYLSEVFELPCGFYSNGKTLRGVQLREISGFEEEILSARKMSLNDKISKVVESCIESIGDFEEVDGIKKIVANENKIDDRKKIKELLPTVSSIDGIYLVICLRRTSLGNNMSRTARCPKCGIDGVRIFDLSKLGFTKGTSAEREYPVTVPSGLKFEMKISDLSAEKVMEATENKADSKFTAALTGRVLKIEGQVPSLETIKQLGLRDRNCLRNEWIRREGSLDPGYEVHCNECGEDYIVGLDLSDPEFFFPTEG